MSTHPSFLLVLLLATGLAARLQAQDDGATELSRVAEAYVAAYNGKDLDAIVGLFTPDAEMIDEIDALSASGTDAIREIFESSFTKYPDRRIALDVVDVRQIAKNVVVEEGLARFSGEVPNEEGDVVAYSAVIVKDPEKGWLIASTRELSADEPEIEPLAELYPLEGEWVLQAAQMQMEFSLALSPSGRALVGSAVVTTPSEGSMETEVRIGYDASTGQIRWWTFDDLGGFTQGLWQAMDEGWLVRTEGVTADGESTSAIQTLNFEGEDAIAWSSTHRFMDGEALPDVNLRLVRRPPFPSLPPEAPATEPADAAETSPSNAPKP